MNPIKPVKTYAPPPISVLPEALRDQFMAYLGDQDDDTAIAQMREDIKSGSETYRILHDGLLMFLHNPGLDCVELVQNCANRDVHGSHIEATTWLRELFAKLFEQSTPVGDQNPQTGSML